MDERDYEFVEGQIGYEFKNKDLLRQAFVRRSYSKENGGPDNEILEFIGDKALDIAVVNYLISKHGSMADEYDDFDSHEERNDFYCDLDEGELTDYKRKLVERKTLAHRIDVLCLWPYLIMGEGDIKNKVNQQDSVKEDLFEAIIGAVTLDCNWDYEKILSIVMVMLDPENELEDSDDENYVELIQNWVSKHNGGVPVYRYEEGSYESTFYIGFNGITNRATNIMELHNKQTMRHRCLLSIDVNLPNFRDFGHSKAEARKNVCKFAYEYLERENFLNSIKDEIENPCKAQAINQLEILARRGYFSIPKYDFYEDYDNDGNPIWKCECHIDEYDDYYSAESSSKKNAKKNAAFDMLKFVLEDD